MNEVTFHANSRGEGIFQPLRLSLTEVALKRSGWQYPPLCLQSASNYKPPVRPWHVGTQLQSNNKSD